VCEETIVQVLFHNPFFIIPPHTQPHEPSRIHGDPANHSRNYLTFTSPSFLVGQEFSYNGFCQHCYLACYLCENAAEAWKQIAESMAATEARLRSFYCTVCYEFTGRPTGRSTGRPIQLVSSRYTARISARIPFSSPSTSSVGKGVPTNPLIYSCRSSANLTLCFEPYPTAHYSYRNRRPLASNRLEK
jgi:hypothetical protein